MLREKLGTLKQTKHSTRQEKAESCRDTVLGSQSAQSHRKVNTENPRDWSGTEPGPYGMREGRGCVREREGKPRTSRTGIQLEKSSSSNQIVLRRRGNTQAPRSGQRRSKWSPLTSGKQTRISRLSPFPSTSSSPLSTASLSSRLSRPFPEKGPHPTGAHPLLPPPLRLPQSPRPAHPPCPALRNLLFLQGNPPHNPPLL